MTEKFEPVKPSHKGRLHRALGIPEDEHIPTSTLHKAKQSSDAHMRSMANEALVMRGWHHGGKKK